MRFERHASRVPTPRVAPTARSPANDVRARVVASRCRGRASARDSRRARRSRIIHSIHSHQPSVGFAPFDARAARGVDTNDKSVVVMGVGAILQRVLGRPTGMKRAREDATTTTAAEARDAERRRKRAEDEDFDARDDSDAFESVDDDSNDSTRSGEEEMEEETV